MPFVSGFLRIRGVGHPGQPLPPDGGGEVDPGYGIEEGDRPPFEKPLPTPPPGIWPPPVPAHPIEPVPPGVNLPPGMIWPTPDRPEVTPPISMPPQKLVVLAWIPSYGFKYIVVDPSLKPQPK